MMTWTYALGPGRLRGRIGGLLGFFVTLFFLAVFLVIGTGWILLIT